MITRLLFSFVFLSFLLFSSEIFGQVTLNQNGTIQLTQSAPSGARPDISFNFSDRSAKIELGLLGGLDFFVEGTRAISITNVGDVGIGNFGNGLSGNSPRSKLHIIDEDNTDVSLTTHGYFLIGSTSDRNIAMDNNEIMARNNGAISTLFLNLDGGEVQVGGAVLEGTNSKLSVEHSDGSATNGIFIERGVNIMDGAGENWNLYTFSSGNLAFNENGNTRRILEEDGDFVTGSDRKLKQNINYLKSELDNILLLQPATYRYKSQKDNESQYGFIAQEVQKIYPDLVSVISEESNEELLGINYQEFIPLLTKAVQEQQTIIEAKEERIAQLEQSNKDLESRLIRIEALLTQSQEGIEIPTTNNERIVLTDAQLFTNQPNPFTKNTTIRYFIPETVQQAELRITDSNGKVLKTISITTRGEGQSILEAQALSAGSYFYTLVLDGNILETKQMVLTK